MSAHVEILGIRHHGPGSARSVAAALDELEPDLVIIEGFPELDELIPLAASPQMRPPVAGLVYVADEPGRAQFSPFATFSPEWVAMRWALARDVTVQFADLPAANTLAMAAQHPLSPADGDVGETTDGGGTLADPIGQLAATAGYADPERWWEDAVEHRHTTALNQFAAIAEAMRLVREDAPADHETTLREAAMRRVLRTAMKERERIAVICGAYHAPVLAVGTFPAASADTRLLAGLPKAKVVATWAPWTSDRLALRSGYGAGVSAPGWYHHLFTTWQDDPGDVVPSWLVKTARALREQEFDAPPASVVDASRFAEALAAIRGRPAVGLAELTDATQTVLCGGSSLPLAMIDRRLIVGEDLGQVPPETPMVPLAADLARRQRALRLKPTAAVATITVDLRKDAQLARSILLHRLIILGLPWGRQLDEGRSTGTFKEVWELEWHPEFAVAVIEASVYGSTVPSAAESVVCERAMAAENLASLSTLIEQCLVAELPGALRRTVAILEERTAHQHDVLALLGTIEPLARTRRYGDVRGVDTGAVATVLDAVVTRAAIGLRPACASLDDEAAAQMRSAIDGAQRGIALLDESALRAPWCAALAALADDDGVHGGVAGRVNRMLLDDGTVERWETALRMSRRLSVAAPASAAAAWLDGFLSGEMVVLLHDDALLDVIDDWVSRVGNETFEDLLPLLRRTFSRYETAERRHLATRLRARGGEGPKRRDHGMFDVERAHSTLISVAQLLGLEVADG